MTRSLQRHGRSLAAWSGRQRALSVVLNRLLVAVLALHAPVAAATSATPSDNYAQRPQVRQFIAEMVERHGFVARKLRQLFARAHYQPAIVRAMTPPSEAPAKSWQAYRALFVSSDRIGAGVQFRKDHDYALARAEQAFGVPAEIIVAIIGIETVYGRNTGRYRVIDTLSTLAFDLPRRSEFFRSELENYLLYTREAGIDAYATHGSSAGAIGIPQFMPGSYRRYALDFDGDGRRDLQNSAVDAIGSVANFLRAHAWQPGQPVASPARVSGEQFRTLVDAGIEPRRAVAELGSFGVTVADPLPPEAPCTLIELETPGEPPEYWVGLQNFYALTRYNRSSFYAIAVTELARALSETSP